MSFAQSCYHVERQDLNVKKKLSSLLIFTLCSHSAIQCISLTSHERERFRDPFDMLTVTSCRQAEVRRLFHNTFVMEDLSIFPNVSLSLSIACSSQTKGHFVPRRTISSCSRVALLALPRCSAALLRCPVACSTLEILVVS